MLSMVFTVAFIGAAAFAIWTFTKPGKKWLKDL